MALGGGGLGAMRMEPKRGSRELSHPFWPMRTQQEDCYLWTVAPDTEFAGISILDFVASELWDKHLLYVLSATQSAAICYSGRH